MAQESRRIEWLRTKHAATIKALTRAKERVNRAKSSFMKSSQS